jgi:hypothetical protein
MTQTVAQNLLINSKAQDRRTNYGKHPIETFNDLDLSITNNKTYNSVLSNLDLLEKNYDNTLEELDILISNTTQTYYKLKDEQNLLLLIDTYTYITPNINTYTALKNNINNLIQECNVIVNSILNTTVSNITTYTNPLLLLSINTSLSAIVNRAWYFNYINTIPKIPKIRPANSTLICNNNGEITWQ